LEKAATITPPTPARADKQTAGGGARKKPQASHAKGAKKSRARDSQTIEAEIAETEKRLAALSEEMSLPEVARAPKRLARLNDEYQQTDERLRALYQEWERVAAEATTRA
jgi:predicted  nucleic acid-binding Zn-ribbon protein